MKDDMKDDRPTKVAKAWASVVHPDIDFTAVAPEATPIAEAFLAMFDAAHSCCQDAPKKVAEAVKTDKTDPAKTDK